MWRGVRPRRRSARPARCCWTRVPTRSGRAASTPPQPPALGPYRPLGISNGFSTSRYQPSRHTGRVARLVSEGLRGWVWLCAGGWSDEARRGAALAVRKSRHHSKFGGDCLLKHRLPIRPRLPGAAADRPREGEELRRVVAGVGQPGGLPCGGRRQRPPRAAIVAAAETQRREDRAGGWRAACAEK